MSDAAAQEERRKYPTHKGGKSEWKGMIEHQAENANNLYNFESQIKNQKKETLKSDYLSKFEEQMRELENQKQNKMIDQETMNQKISEYQEAMNKFREDKRSLQGSIASSYEEKMREARSLADMQRMEKLSYEQAMLEQNRQKLESEKRRRQERKMNFKKEVEEDLYQKNYKSMTEKELRERERQEYLELAKRNALREIVKEENYKNFYQQCAQNLGQRQEMYKQTVQSALEEKQRNLENMIAKNVDEYTRKKYQEELDRLTRRHQDMMGVANTLKAQIQEKEHIKEMEKMQRMMQQDERQKDLQSYNEFLEFKKNEKLNRMSDYRSFLENQSQEKSAKQLADNRMTRQEKKLNMADLQAYKGKDPNLYSMIPGWSPQIGALPSRVKPTLDGNMSSVISPPAQKGLSNSQGLFQSPNNFSQTPNMNSKGQYNYASHNPITNPNPFVNQNPYLRPKQGNVLSQAGANLLN